MMQNDTTEEISRQDREFLLLKVQELDLENIELKKKLASKTRLEVAVRTCAQVDPVARELLEALD